MKCHIVKKTTFVGVRRLSSATESVKCTEYPRSFCCTNTDCVAYKIIKHICSYLQKRNHTYTDVN